jgi:hypothetical protein
MLMTQHGADSYIYILKVEGIGYAKKKEMEIHE